MSEYALEIAKSVEKELRKIPVKMYENFFKEIENLAITFQNQYIRKSKGQLIHLDCESVIIESCMRLTHKLC